MFQRRWERVAGHVVVAVEDQQAYEIGRPDDKVHDGEVEEDQSGFGAQGAEAEVGDDDDNGAEDGEGTHDPYDNTDSCVFVAVGHVLVHVEIIKRIIIKKLFHVIL